jgi:acetoin utilization deacetylase AcuC-like enzyme
VMAGSCFDLMLDADTHDCLDARPAALADVCRVHEWSYVAKLQDHCKSLDVEEYGRMALKHLDGDTVVSRDSFKGTRQTKYEYCHCIEHSRRLL